MSAEMDLAGLNELNDAQRTALAAPLVTASRIVKMDEEMRRITHVISSARLDRGGRYIQQDGWSLTDYRKNNIVLADHDYSITSIIGNGHDVGVVNDELQATTEFGQEGLGPLAFRLVQAGLAKAWSVGWQGTKGHTASMGVEDGCPICAELRKKTEWAYHYVKQALLEYSLVAVPANPDAVMRLQAAGFEISKQERDLWVQFGEAETPAVETAATPDGAKVEAESYVVPSRPTEFYDGLFKLGRAMNRKVVAQTIAQRFK